MHIDELLSDDELQAVVSCFYDAVYTDPILSPLFAGVERKRQEQRLCAFIQMTAHPGSEPFDGPYLRDAHSRLALTPALFDRRHELLERAIRACGHGEEIVEAFHAFDERWRSWVLSSQEHEALFD